MPDTLNDHRTLSGNIRGIETLLFPSRQFPQLKAVPVPGSSLAYLPSSTLFLSFKQGPAKLRLAGTGLQFSLTIYIKYIYEERS